MREILEEALAQRGRYYSNHFSFSIRFEADDTSAARDTTHFQHIMQLLKLPKARELVLMKDNRKPIWTVIGLVQDLDRKISKADGRSLVIGHYAGHGAVKDDKLVFFGSQSSRNLFFGFELTLGTLFEDRSSVSVFEKTDVIFIIDSCYSGNCTRGLGATGRSVECWYAEGVLSHWVVAIATRSLGPIARYIKY